MYKKYDDVIKSSCSFEHSDSILIYSNEIFGNQILSLTTKTHFINSYFRKKVNTLSNILIHPIKYI